MSWMIAAIVILSVLLLLAILLNPVLLVLVLRPALQCADGGSRKPQHVAAALLGWVVDVLGVRTWWRLIAGPKQGRERTISDTLERLAHPYNMLDPNHALYVEWSKYINRVSPTQNHIKAVL